MTGGTPMTLISMSTWRPQKERQAPLPRRAHRADDLAGETGEFHREKMRFRREKLEIEVFTYFW